MTLTMEEKLTNAIAACEDTYEDDSVSSETSSLQYITSSYDKDNGFKANLYRNTVTGKYVVCFCGSNDKQDWLGSDLQMAKNVIPDQLENAKDFIDNIKDEKGNKISISDIEMITGHSLGGSLAQLIGQMEQYKNIDIITLNAYGTNNMQESLMDKYQLSSDYTNINNFIIEGDVVANSGKHIGNVYEIPPLFLQNIYKKIGFSLCLVPSLAIPAFIKSEIIAHNGILDNSQNLFITATETAPIRRDPLLVDLDGDGIETTTVENGVFFDHQNDGFAETSAWVGQDDGILAFDKNNNGTIDNGTEIFGDSYTKADGTMAANGFEALAEFDTNSDGVINAQDSDFANLKILKGDGNLLTLEQAGIDEISLSNTETNTTDVNGNTQSHEGTFTKNDGTTGKIGDYLLQNNKMNSIATDWVDVPSDIEALPDVSGSGTLYSLHQAMARDTSGALKTLMQSFISSPNPESKMQIAKQIIFRWTGVNNIVEDSRGANINAKELAALEKFMGQEFVGVDGTSVPNEQAANILNSAFSTLYSYVYAELAAQTHLKPLFDLLEINFDTETNTVSYNLDNITASIRDSILMNDANGASLLKDFDKTLKSLGLVSYSNYDKFYETFAAMGENYKLIMDTSDKNSFYGTDGNDNFDGTANGEAYFTGLGNDTVYARQGNDIVYAGDGNDYIDVCEGDDIVFAGNGNDTIYGGGGNDIIDGGSGADKMYGGDGHDIYYVDNVNDVVVDEYEYDSSFANINDNNKIISSVTYTLPSGVANLVLTGSDNINATGNSLANYIIGNDGNNVLRGLGSIAGCDFDVLDGGLGADTMIGGMRSDTYYVDNVGDVIIDPSDDSDPEFFSIDRVHSTIDYTILNTNLESITLEGTDNINAIGNSKNNVLVGNSGDNLLIGYEGNDYLDSTGGADTMIGGVGNDQYVIYTGEESIIENANEGTDNVISYVNFTLGDNIENVELIGYTANIATGNELDNQIIGNYNTNDILTGNEGNDVLNGRVFEDKNYGTKFYDLGILNSLESGYDTMIGGVGDDTYFVNNQLDIVVENINEGDDTVITNCDYVLTENVENLILENFDIGLKGTGNDSNNVITGGFNNDTLIGGAGNDTLNGYYGNDTYEFVAGDKQDNISDIEGNDTVLFDKTVNKNNIAFFTDSSGNLFIDYGEQSGNDIIKIENQNNSEYAIENFKITDSSGTVHLLTSNDINQIIQNMSTFAADNGLSINSVQDVKDNSDLMNLISNSWSAAA